MQRRTSWHSAGSSRTLRDQAAGQKTNALPLPPTHLHLRGQALVVDVHPYPGAGACSYVIAGAGALPEERVPQIDVGVAIAPLARAVGGPLHQWLLQGPGILSPTHEKACRDGPRAWAWTAMAAGLRRG